MTFGLRFSSEAEPPHFPGQSISRLVPQMESGRQMQEPHFAHQSQLKFGLESSHNPLLCPNWSKSQTRKKQQNLEWQGESFFHLAFANGNGDCGRDSDG